MLDGSRLRLLSGTRGAFRRTVLPTTPTGVAQLGLYRWFVQQQHLQNGRKPSYGTCSLLLSQRLPSSHILGLGLFRQRIGMDRHRLDPHILLRPVLLIHGDLLDLSQRLQARVAQNLAEHSVQPVQVRRRSKRDEELAAVRVGTLVCHADHAALVVSQPWADFIFEG